MKILVISWDDTPSLGFHGGHISHLPCFWPWGPLELFTFDILTFLFIKVPFAKEIALPLQEHNYRFNTLPLWINNQTVFWFKTRGKMQVFF